MKTKFAAIILLTILMLFPFSLSAQQTAVNDTAPSVSQGNTATDSLGDAQVSDSMDEVALAAGDDMQPEHPSFYKSLKTKFIEGNAGFMSFVALALVLGLAFCIERIIYLSLSEINAKRFMANLDAKISAGDIEGGKALCRDTRGPVASICYQGLARINESIDNIERKIVSYGSVQSANLEKGRQDYAFHCHGSFFRFPWHGGRYGDGL